MSDAENWNQKIIDEFRANEGKVGGQFEGAPLLLLTTTGAKSMPRPVDRLADRELEVLELIGRGNTTRQIADKLQLGPATVDTYRARIKEKMNLRNATELQHFAIRWVREQE